MSCGREEAPDPGVGLPHLRSEAAGDQGDGGERGGRKEGDKGDKGLLELPSRVLDFISLVLGTTDYLFSGDI